MESIERSVILHSCVCSAAVLALLNCRPPILDAPTSFLPLALAPRIVLAPKSCSGKVQL